MIVELLIGLVVGLVVFLYRRYTKLYGCLEASGIPVKPPTLCFGSGPWLIHKYDMHLLDQALQKHFGTLTYGLYEGPQPVIHTIDPEIIKEVFIKQFDKFPLRMEFDVGEEMSTLDIMKGDVWKHMRKTLSPALSTGKIKAMLDHIDAVTDKSVVHIRNNIKKSGGRFELKDTKMLFTCIALEVIQKVAFGVDSSVIDEEKLNTDTKIFKMMMEAISSMTPQGMFGSLMFCFFFQHEPKFIELMFGAFAENAKCKLVMHELPNSFRL